MACGMQAKHCAVLASARTSSLGAVDESDGLQAPVAGVLHGSLIGRSERHKLCAILEALHPLVRRHLAVGRCLAAVHTIHLHLCTHPTEHTVNNGVLGKLCGQPTSQPASVGATRRALQESPPASKAGTDNFDKEGSFASAIFPMDHTGMDNSGVTSSTPRNLEV